MSEFVAVIALNQLPPGQGTTVTVSGKNIALFNVAGVIHAMDDACLHAGASLGCGKFEGKTVTCRAHGWRYNVTTGDNVNVPDYGVKTYPVKIEGEKILVALT